MKGIGLIGSLLVVLLAMVAPVLAQPHVFHDLRIIINPDEQAIEVENQLTLPDALLAQSTITFYLHQGFSVTSDDAKVSQISDTALTAQNAQRVAKGGVALDQFTVQLLKDAKTFTLRYHGNIHHTVKTAEKESARSFSDTPGIVDASGVYLANSSAWYPWFNHELITFKLKVVVPVEWNAVSQGIRTQDVSGHGMRFIQWEENQPQDDMYLVAAKFTEYSQSAGAVQAMAFLLQPDQPLAQKYLDVTGQYIEMYRQLIGAYPYKKFALVENHWESGFGMPSFTLLGSRVIRFPFILHSSFPHEILHNWWGNSVYAKSEQGNWAEGLTTYLADHLIKEQRGKGVGYRRDVLQKYTDFVNAGSDFALKDFRSRHSSSTEAVGYGKTMMLFHMLRQRIGDEAFTRVLHTFYRKYQFSRAGFEDLQQIFSEVSEVDLTKIFDQWVNRVGAPILAVKQVKTVEQAGQYRITVDIEQTQPGLAYQLKLPIAVHMAGVEQALQKVMRMDSKFMSMSLLTPQRPVHLDIDPEFDLFRRLDRNEIPPALSQGFGAERALMVLPSQAPPALLAGYRQLAEQWQQSLTGKMSISLDHQVQPLPSDKAVWLLGWQNQYTSLFAEQVQQHQAKLKAGSAKFAGKQHESSKYSVILSARNPDNPAQSLFFLASDNIKALPGLARKLPHYRKYSYLAFAGDEPNNVTKGQWPVLESPLSMSIAVNGQPANLSTKAKLMPRSALAQLPTVFSATRMMADVNFLADPKMQGRGLGSPELDQAADYIAAAFKASGLIPGGADEQSYYQTESITLTELNKTVTLKNVIGILPGSNKEYAGQSIIVSAHYDHLGTGWPDVHQGDEGQVHPGADDNASGVAVMLALARTLGKKWQPERTVIFIAFSGEEAGRLGSKYYVANTARYPTDKIYAVMNMDTVGRVGEQPITVFGTGSATEWVHIFRGIGFVTGLKIKSVPEDFGSSDQHSFIEQGIPAVHVFGAVHEDFHRPTDTVDKVMPASLMKVAMLMKEALDYLGSRQTPLTVTLANAKLTQPVDGAREQGRKVSIGTIPDFTYQGEGVRITGVTADSSAQRLGLQAGDILVELNGILMSNLRAYAKILRTLAPGDNVDLVYLRDGQPHRGNFKIQAR